MTEAKLLSAQNTTIQLFNEAINNGLVVPGKTESELAAEITELALNKFGIKEHWHKKIVRSGPNTLAIYRDNPPDRVIQPDDILFIDFGPIVNGYEADIGRTYVLGDDPLKHKQKKDVEEAWYAIQQWYKNKTTLKASDLFGYAVQKADEYGWTFSGDIAGHIAGKYPHEQPADPKSWELDIHPDNHNDIFLPDANGNKRHWVLELQFTDSEKQTGSYFEQLLNTGI